MIYDALEDKAISENVSEELTSDLLAVSVSLEIKGFSSTWNHHKSHKSLALSALFEYPCYGSTAIINIWLLQYRDRLWMSESDVCRRQILTSKFGSRAERVEFKLNVDISALNQLSSILIMATTYYT